MKFPKMFAVKCVDHRWSRMIKHNSIGPYGERTVHECLDCLAVKVELRHLGDTESEAVETTIVEPQHC